MSDTEQAIAETKPRRRLKARDKLVALRYIETGNQTEAYHTYHPRATRESATTGAANFFARPEVREFTQGETQRFLDRNGLNANAILKEYARLGFSNIGDYLSFGPSGVQLKDSSELTREQLAAIESVKESVTASGVTTSLKLHGKREALRDLGEHLGLFKTAESEKNITFNVLINGLQGELAQAVEARVKGQALPEQDGKGRLGPPNNAPNAQETRGKTLSPIENKPESTPASSKEVLGSRQGLKPQSESGEKDPPVTENTEKTPEQALKAFENHPRIAQDEPGQSTPTTETPQPKSTRWKPAKKYLPTQNQPARGTKQRKQGKLEGVQPTPATQGTKDDPASHAMQGGAQALSDGSSLPQPERSSNATELERGQGITQPAPIHTAISVPHDARPNENTATPERQASTNTAQPLKPVIGIMLDMPLSSEVDTFGTGDGQGGGKGTGTESHPSTPSPPDTEEGTG